MREAERLGQEGSLDLWMQTLGGHWVELGLAAWLLGSFPSERVVGLGRIVVVRITHALKLNSIQAH